MGLGSNHNIPTHDTDRPWGRDATNNNKQRIRQMDNYVDFYDFIMDLAEYDILIQDLGQQANENAQMENDQ